MHFIQSSKNLRKNNLDNFRKNKKIKLGVYKTNTFDILNRVSTCTV
jgi:hypothetical protein